MKLSKMEALYMCLLMLTACKLVSMVEPTTQSVCPYGEDKCDAVPIIRIFAQNICDLLSWKVEIENQYNTEIATLKNETLALQNETLALKNETSTLRDALNNETSTLKNETSVLKNETSALKNETSALQNALKDANSEVTKLNNETSALKNETSTLTNALNNETAQNNALKKEISALKKTLKNKTSTLQNALKDANSDITKLQNKTTALTNALMDEIKTLKSETRALMNVLTDKMTAQKDEISVLKDTVTLLKNTMPDLFTNCLDVYKSGLTQSGVYTLTIKDGQNKLHQVPVFCDMDTTTGGWTVFQRRQDGTVRFDRIWDEYRHGFGDLDSEFWLGNEWIHLMTASQKNFTLRVDLESFDGEARYAQYENFKISDETDKYRLHIGSYSGTAGEDRGYGLSYHNDQQFTTKDEDNDRLSSVNCALSHGGGGGFWYDSCELANLNGVYRHSEVEDDDGINWHAWLQYKTPKHTEMKFKPVN